MQVEDYDRLRQHYARLEDEELRELALVGAETLRPEALELLRSEISRRRMGKEVEAGIQAQLQDLTPDREAELVDRFRRQPCPWCGAANGFLNAFPIAEARSFLFVTSYKKWLSIGCATCIRRAAAKATTTTFLLGWWGVPWGPIRTLQALVANRRAGGADEHAGPTPELVEHVKANRGEIAAMLHAAEAPRHPG